MLVSRLFRSLLRFLSPGIVPDEGVGAPAPVEAPAAAPVADTSPAPVASPAPAAPTAPADPMAGLRDLIDNVGSAPNADPAAGGIRARDPLGRFAPTSAPTPAVPGAAPVPTAAPVAGPAAPAVAPKPGEVDLTPPEGMSERAQQRWSQLTERAKQVPVLEQRASQAETHLQSVRQLVQEAGLAPQEFTGLLDMARLSKSQNPQDAQRALQLLDTMRADLAVRFGLDVPGADPLAVHPDLKADVDGMLMTRERALEVARLRQQGQQHQATTREQQDMANFRQTVQAAAQSMDRTLQQRSGTPGHEQKVAYIKQHFASPQNLQAFVATYQPQQWPAVLTTMYDAYQPQAAAPVAPATVQPLRPNSVRSGPAQRSGPVTAQSAIDNAWAAAGL